MEKGFLVGKIVVIKDNVIVVGVLMMNGSKFLEGFVFDRDVIVVIRILDVGMGFICVLNNYCNNWRYLIKIFMFIVM